MVKKTIIPATKKLGKELIKEASPEHKLRVCAYVRVSTDSDEQLESFNAQIGRYKRIIQEEHADAWEFVGIFADTESGTSIDKREEFQDMMDKCREGLIDLILVKQMSRFGRNTINTLQAIYELRNLGVEVYFETDELYASNSKLDFMLTMYSALAQEESRQQSVRVSSGIHERMESGNISKRVRPILGYRKDNFDKIYIYEPEAIAIRTVFMLFVSNIKMHDVDRFIRRDFASLNFSKTFRTRMYESIMVSQNQKWRLDVDRKAGRYYIDANRMLGFSFDENKNAVINEEEAKVVRLIFALYLDDMGVTAIVDYLTKNGIKNKRGFVSWSITSVRYILKNEKYVGDCLLVKRYSEDPLTKKRVYNRGQREQYYIKNGHQGIIDRATWDAVQEKFRVAGEKYNLHSYARQNMGQVRIRYEFVGWILCPYCGRNYIVKTNHYNGKPTHKHLMCYSNHQYKLCKSENYPLDVFKQILTKQIKILKSNIPSLNELLVDKFSKDEQEPIIERIKALDSQIESLRTKYNDIKDYHDDYFTSLQKETLNKIGELTKEKTDLQNSVSPKTPSERAKETINKLKALPDEFDDVENVDSKSVFSRAAIVDKGLIYFVIGDGELTNPQPRPELFFKSSIEYKIRKSVFTTQFGVVVIK